MKRLVLLIVAIVVAMPISVVLTWLLMPLWNWFENSLGIESVGHSGPADWCYLATITVVEILVLAGWSYLWFASKRPEGK